MGFDPSAWLMKNLNNRSNQHKTCDTTSLISLRNLGHDRNQSRLHDRSRFAGLLPKNYMLHKWAL